MGAVCCVCSSLRTASCMCTGLSACGGWCFLAGGPGGGGRGDSLTTSASGATLTCT